MNSFAEPGASFRAVLTTQVPNKWAIYSPSGKVYSKPNVKESNRVDAPRENLFTKVDR